MNTLVPTLEHYSPNNPVFTSTASSLMLYVYRIDYKLQNVSWRVSDSIQTDVLLTQKFQAHLFSIFRLHKNEALGQQ